MNYYSSKDEDELEPWYGMTWAYAEAPLWEEMAEALNEHLDDGVPHAIAAMTYLEEVDGVLDEDTVYTAEQIAELFTTRVKAEYENWGKVAQPWIDDHYPGLLDDPLIRDAFGHGIAEWEDDLGRIIAKIDEHRYWWHETDSGTILAVLRPGHTSDGSAQ